MRQPSIVRYTAAAKHLVSLFTIPGITKKEIRKMTDIGFGLINRRTVIVALFCLVISVSIFNNQLPINTKNVGDIFIDTALFTGYLLLLRTIYLLPFAILFSIVIGYAQVYGDLKTEYPSPDSMPKIKYYALFIISKTIHFLRSIIYFLWFIPSFFVVFGKWLGYYRLFRYDVKVESGKLKVDNESAFTNAREQFIKGFIRFFDRAGLIFIIVLSTIPRYTPYVKILGEIGLVLSIAIFLIRGDFSFIVKDNVGDKDFPVT